MRGTAQFLGSQLALLGKQRNRLIEIVDDKINDLLLGGARRVKLFRGGIQGNLYLGNPSVELDQFPVVVGPEEMGLGFPASDLVVGQSRLLRFLEQIGSGLDEFPRLIPIIRIDRC